MFRKKCFLWGLIFFLFGAAHAEQQSMIVYSSITVVGPITELAKIFEKREGIRVMIAQGGAEDMYKSAKASRVGDVYFASAPTFLFKHQAEGLFGYNQIVGYNQIALVVQKGNPKRVKGDVRELLRKDLHVIIGSIGSGSIGYESKSLLETQKIYCPVFSRADYILPDSRAINSALKSGYADVALNWRATAFFPENADALDVVDLSRKIAKPQALYMIALKSSRDPAMTKRFIDMVASEEGQVVMRKYGFLDNHSNK